MPCPYDNPVMNQTSIPSWPYPGVHDIYEAGDRSFVETLEAVYDEQLNVLPPTAIRGGAFLVGEAYDHVSEDGRSVGLYTAFYRVEGRFFCRMETVSEFAKCQSVAAIREQFRIPAS